MIVTSLAIGGGALVTTVKVYRDKKREKEFPWTVAAERFTKKKKKKKGVYFAQQVARLRHNAREFVGELVAPYVSQTRHQQLAEITAKKEGLETSEAEKEALHGFVLASCGTFLAVGGSLFYAPLYVPSLLIIGYLFKDAFKDTYKALVEERRMLGSAAAE